MPRSKCAVDGCNEDASHAFDLNDNGEGAPIVQVAVCDFHMSALSAGEAYDYDIEHRTLRVGGNASLELITWSVKQSVGTPDIVTLKLGHDGIVTQEVRLRVTPKFLELVGEKDLGDFIFGRMDFSSDEEE